MLLAGLILPACTADEPATNNSADLAARPFDVVVPASYDAQQPAPLIVLLHGFGSDATAVAEYFGIDALAQQRGFLYVVPTGTPDAAGQPFWNATDACCDLDGIGPDDAGYLSALVEQVQADYSIDPKRIYFVGHSNGGFMSYRMACDHADQVAAIVSLAGATWADPAACAPLQPVSVLQIHGTADGVIAYDGGAFAGHVQPGALANVETWATYNGCSSTFTTTDGALDLDTSNAGAETSVLAYTGCPAAGAVELWSIAGGAHSPALSDSFTASLVDFLLAHPKA